ncbi:MULTISPECIES: hypothetical protein [unclassified Aeromicrobium]|uniref:hypothetical protein n=1 Tax=unclassified Aeromicrobium TaxID=2633570 RepID=UPI00396B182D
MDRRWLDVSLVLVVALFAVAILIPGEAASRVFMVAGAAGVFVRWIGATWLRSRLTSALDR